MKPIRQLETRVARTYLGGRLIDEFLGKEAPADTGTPEDWISSFVAAKNRVYVENEGLTRVEGGFLKDMVTPEMLGEGRDRPGVLIKLLDAGERLGIQVHPTKAYAMEHFGVPYGKTECWHILATRNDEACVYVGFQEWVTKEFWKELFDKQDIPGMLGAMHRIFVKPGDTILVTGGTPHAIGAGCFLLEIQEPTDYTMRVEKVTLAGEVLTPMQIHYGVGEEAMLDCFAYTPRSREAVVSEFLLKPSRVSETMEELVRYTDTPCFALKKCHGANVLCEPCFTTAVMCGEGSLECEGEILPAKRGDKFFIPANCPLTLRGEAILCYPPKV